MHFPIINPATGRDVDSIPGHSGAQAHSFITATTTAQTAWKRTSFAERASILHTAASLLEERAERLAHTIAVEMGKPLTEGIAEAKKCAWVCRFYAERSEAFLRSEPCETDASLSYVAFQPLGVVLGIMPWNFPLWQVFRFAAPTLMAGNACLLKHASNVPKSALNIQTIFTDAGLPEHLFRTLLIHASQVPDVLDHPGVRAATLTGSTEAGRAVAAACGARLLPCVLELGGSDPYLILADADIPEAAKICATSRLLNAGQSCIAAKRFLVEAPVYSEFLAALNAEFRRYTLADPVRIDTRIGPLARVDLRDELHNQVQRSINAGARLVLGGTIPHKPGAWYPPTILADVPPTSPAWVEELFGPVAAVTPVKDADEAVMLANQSIFGLGAAVFTSDLQRGQQIAEQSLDAGCCFVNGLVKSDPRLPFGGIKGSGFGRELGRAGARAFTNQKTVWLA